MSVEKITLTRYQCTCDLTDCPGKGKTWVSKDDHIPDRCAFCGRRTWNGPNRRNRFITINGRTKRLSKWAAESGISAQCIGHRIKMGWSEYDAVTVAPGT